MWHKNMGLISKMIDKMLMMLLPWFTFVFSTSAKDISYDDKLYLSHTSIMVIPHYSCITCIERLLLYLHLGWKK
jgi:hypothetical protein